MILTLFLLFVVILAVSDRTNAKVKPGVNVLNTGKKELVVLYEGDSLTKLGIRSTSTTKKEGIRMVEATREEAEELLAKDPKLKIYANEFPFDPKVFNASPMFSDPQYAASWYFQQSDVLPTNGYQDLWKQGITGKGVTILIVDDSVSFSHPELIGKKNENYSYNYKNSNKLTDPDTLEQTHGTSVAGVIASIPGNHNCGVGIAPAVDIAARVAIYQGVKPTSLINALTDDISGVSIVNNSWGIEPCDVGELIGMGSGKCHLLPNIGVEQAFKSVITQGRFGRGGVIVFPAGNQGENPNADTNLCPLTRSPYAITVGAVLKSGKHAPYSNPGKSVFISGPSGDINGSNGVVAPKTRYDPSSNTLIHECINNFTGTSAAVPIVSGAISMILQQNPYLTYQDVRQILMHSAKKIDESDPSWHTNMSGVSYSKYYGFGYVDVDAATKLAVKWPATSTYSTQTASIPSNWEHAGEDMSYLKYVDGADILIPKGAAAIIPFFFKTSDSVIIESIVAKIGGIANKAVTISLAYIKNGSDAEREFNEIISVNEEGKTNPDDVLETILGTLGGVIDTSVELLTYEYSDMISSGSWELKIENLSSGDIKIPLSSLSLVATGLPSILEVNSIEAVYTDGYLSNILIKPTVNAVDLVAYKYGRGMYAYIKVGDKEPVIVTDESGEARNIDPMSNVIDIPWKSEYGCQKKEGTNEVDLGKCKPYDSNIQIVLVNAEGTNIPFEFTTSQNICSITVSIQITISYDDHLTCEEEEEEEECKEEEEAEEGCEEQKEEEEEECIIPIPEEEEELCPPEEEEECKEEEECIIEEEEICEEGAVEEEECVIEEECEEELYPEECEEIWEECEEEEETNNGRPIPPPDEEETSDGFEIPSNIAKLTTALAALLVALMM